MTKPRSQEGCGTVPQVLDRGRQRSHCGAVKEDDVWHAHILYSKSTRKTAKQCTISPRTSSWTGMVPRSRKKMASLYGYTHQAICPLVRYELTLFRAASLWVWRLPLKCGVMLCFRCACIESFFSVMVGDFFGGFDPVIWAQPSVGSCGVLVHQSVRLLLWLRLWQLGLLSPGPSHRLTETTSSIRRPTNLFAALRTVGQCRCCTSFGRCPWVSWFKPLGPSSAHVPA